MGLYESLQEYAMRGIIPMHMPGHKRNPRFNMVNPYAIDITEVQGMDDLHQPVGVIRELMNRCREFYGTKDTYLCLNGSTSANMIAIAASCKRGEVIVTDANAHRSVPNAVELLGLKSVRVVRPDLEGSPRVPGPVRPEDVKELFHHLSRAGRTPAAIVITSPTYEGVVSDIQAIADVVHPYGAVMIVDSAHGAHLKLASKVSGLKLSWPVSAIDQDADFVIESMHKTLPALTQTSLLHRCSDRVSDADVMHMHDVFVTSSPSYVLMASMDQCMSYQEREGERAFRIFDDRLKKIYDAADKARSKSTRHDIMTLLDCKGRDPSKLVIYGDGERAAALLRSNGVEPERVEESHTILMTSIADTPESLERVTALALR
ncbi:MAG: aminotransferase class I/II-fold pyridoxal phosphate-dependent enzyme [Eubacterium sp.]|nr:aminotransferase class I/II-fold pyridoxal phosphate-dependent enzyme [Eubacterium sp.]